MSPPARALLALAVAALLRAAVGCSHQDKEHCNKIHEGDTGDLTVKASEVFIYIKEIVIDLPPSQCPSGTEQVGTAARACDYAGTAPALKWEKDGKSVRVTRTSDGGHGLEIVIEQDCKKKPNPGGHNY